MRPAVSRFADRMGVELERHEKENDSSYTKVKFDDLLGRLERHAEKLRWVIQMRLRAKTPDELTKAIEAIKKQAAHVGNYAMFIHDNAAMGRSL